MGWAKRLRAKKRRRLTAAARIDKFEVWDRQNGRCYAEGIGKTCTGVMQDPHELISVGQGGLRISTNRVGVCRRCHDETQGRVGGNRLFFDWPGKDEGRQPDADTQGNVTVRWRERP